MVTEFLPAPELCVNGRLGQDAVPKAQVLPHAKGYFGASCSTGNSSPALDRLQCCRNWVRWQLKSAMPSGVIVHN